MRTSHLTLIVTVVAAFVLGACQTDPISGPSHVVGEPLLDMVFGPAGNAVFPTVSGARITTAAARDTIEFTVNALPPTGAGNTYQIVLVDTASGATTAPSARIIRTVRSRRPVNRDSSVAVTKVDTATAAQFSIADTATTVAIRIANTAIATRTHVLLRSAGEGSVPPTLTAARTGFLSFRYKSGTAYAVQAAVFGSFAKAAADRLRFIVSAYVVNASFWGDQVRLSFRNLIRPPAGFRYAAWMVDERTGTSTRLGGILSPVPENAPLDDADLGTGKWYNDVGVLEAQVRGDLKALNIVPQDYTFITLASRSATPGKVFGTVTSASGKSLLNTTVYLQGINMTVPGQVASASATGTWQFRAVPTGVYKAYAIPFGDAVIRDSATVTVGSQKVNNVLTGDSLFVTLRIP
jgi:hypothetical protein